MYELLRTDVLVVGGGGAGCRAAIEAHDRGADVVAIVKGRVGNSGCTVNVGTSASVGPWGVEGDSNEASMRDLLAHGGFLGNQEMVKALVEESTSRILELQEWGVDFERDADGAILVNRSAAHSHPRNITFKPVAPRKHDYGYPPGVAMMDALEDQMRGRDIRVMEEVALVDLLTADGRVVGAVALDYANNKLVVVHAKATVLATGSFSQVFSRNTVSHFETGDGHAAAFRAGAELIDMEGTQYIASTVGYPAGSVMTNGRGERFLERHGVPEAIRADKETMVYAVWKEIREGRGTEGGNIFVDMTSLRGRREGRLQPDLVAGREAGASGDGLRCVRGGTDRHSRRTHRDLPHRTHDHRGSPHQHEMRVDRSWALRRRRGRRRRLRPCKARGLHVDDNPGLR